MRPKPAGLLVGLSLLCMPTAMLAHHQLDAQFDTTKTVTLTGEVEKIDWRNPHVRLYLEVKDPTNKDASNKVTWEVDMGPPNLQIINGWKIDTYRPGDRVKVDIYPAKDGSNVGYGKKVTALPRSE